MNDARLEEWMRRCALGELVCRLREKAGLNQPDLANAAGIPQSAVSLVENGRRAVTPDVAWKLDDALGAKGSLVLAARDSIWGVIDPGTEAASYAILDGLASGDRPEVRSTRRREFFGVSGGMAAGAVVGPHLVDQALVRGSVSPQHLDWIEEETQSIARQVFRVSDQRPLLGPAMEQYTTIASLLNEPQRTPDRRRLTRAVANICGALAEITRDTMGDVRGARAWFRTARAAALDAGDPYLADMTLMSSAITDLYEGNPQRVLSQLGPRLEAKARPTGGLAKLNGVAARAHAMLGDRSASRRYLATAEETLDRSPEPDIEAWESFDPAQLAFHAANAALALSDTQRAIQAADRSIERFDNEWVDRFNVRFDKATALHKGGEMAEACRVATEIITDPDLPVMNFGIKAKADQFDRRLGKTTIGPVADWRGAYHDRLPDPTS